MKYLLTIMAITLSITGCSTATAATNKPVAPVTNAPAEKTVSDDQIQYAFTQAGQHPEKVLVGVINGAKSSLDIAIYSLTQKDIVAAILDAKKRGLAVRIVTDRTEAKTKSQAAALKELKTAGIPIKENTHSGLMHLKVTIVDKAVVTTGSYNYSESASTVNDEVLMVVKDPKVAMDWEAQFERMWGDTKDFEDYK